MRSAPFRSKPNETVTRSSLKWAVNDPPSAVEATKSSLGTLLTSTPAFMRHERVASAEYVFVPPPQPATTTTSPPRAAARRGGNPRTRRFSHAAGSDQRFGRAQFATTSSSRALAEDGRVVIESCLRRARG